MKGVEGLPLKYIAIVLVAAIVIAAVYSIVSNFTSTASTNAQKFQNTSTGVFNVQTKSLCATGCGADINDATKMGKIFNEKTGTCNCSAG